MTEPECPSRAAERYERERELAEEITAGEIYQCEKHGEKFPASGFCGACFVEDIQETDRLIAEAKADGTWERCSMETKEGTHKGIAFLIGPRTPFPGIGWTIPKWFDGKKLESGGAFYDDCEDHPEGAYAWAESAVKRFIDLNSRRHAPRSPSGGRTHR
jgi:hypothetical protein